ncbi:arginine--tRNA ligase [Patescibacteria group bacterium]|nr:arginine--tRNA ligase [Patescibacteria group bacterium]
MIRKLIRTSIEETMKEGRFPKTDFDVSQTSNESFGDYSTNVLLRLSSLGSKQSPKETAKFFIPALEKYLDVSKVVFSPPGFINIHLGPKQIQIYIQKIVEEDKSFGSNKLNNGKRARVEFISANPTGPLHIGNARGGPLGDSISNVLEYVGYKVTREYYDNNVGSQVDIFCNSLMYLINKKFGKREDISKQDVNRYAGTYVEELADKTIEKLKIVGLDGVVSKSKEIREDAIQSLFSEIMADSKDIGIKFDEIQHEADLQDSKATEKVVDYLKSKGVTKEKDGALWFAPKDEFLKDRDSVLIRSNGTYTYFADDIAYHRKKFESKADIVINVLGSNHHGHVPRLLAAIKALGYDTSKYKVILYQYVRVLKGKDIVKMSKRAGNYVTAREVLDEVGKDAFRFFLLSHSPDTHMDFDLQQAKEKNESNPVFYVQYAHARCSNILKKAQEEGFGHEKFSKVDLSLLTEPQELSLAKKLLKLPELVEDISESLAVHQLTTYSVEVADLLHKYYEGYRVIGEKENILKARLNLILATKIVLRNTLSLIGVSTPVTM